MPDPYRFFRIEAAELCSALEAGLLELERGAAAPEAAVANVLRHAHTLKGAARVVRHEASASLAHAIEDVLVPVREGTIALSPELVSRALALVDTLRSALSELIQPTASAQAAPSARPAEAPMDPAIAEAPPRPRPEAPAHRDTVNRLLETATAIGAELTRLESTRARLGRVRRRTTSQADYPALHVAGATSLALIDDGFGAGQEEIGRAERELSMVAEVTLRHLRELREGLERLRLVDSEDLRGPLDRTVRDAALGSGKRVLFEFHGGGLRIEPELHLAMGKALLQAVKNAVVHGIEAPEARTGLGKPPEGRIVVSVEGRGGTVVFSCEDDGRGLDLKALRHAFAARNAPNTPPPSESALIDALLSGGISTASNVSAVAGRGIGLDLIRDAARSVGATLDLRHQPGRGVHLRIVAKAELAAFPALLVEAAGTVYALPLEVLSQANRHAFTGSWSGGVVVDGRIVPFFPLASLLDVGAKVAGSRATWTIVVLGEQDDVLAVGVDRLLGTESVVVQPMPEAARVNPALAGISSAVDGRMRFLLDATWLKNVARQRGGSIVPEEAAPPLVLVIDDSLTTRMLERSILESAGYEVEMATSGEEGLSMARAKKYALFLVDVEMPGIDGFTFIEATQADPSLSSTPAILVTSRNSPEDLARGVRVGARGHVVKSEFDQVELLQLIEGLVVRS